MGLKAELAKKEQEFKERKAKNETKRTGRTLLVEKPESSSKKIKTPSVSSLVVKRDFEAEAWEKSRKCLEEKAILYQKLQEGDYHDVDASIKDNLLVDFDRQSRVKAEDKADEYVEYEDEYGRSRKILKSVWEQMEIQRNQRLAEEFIEQLRPKSPERREDGLLHYDDTAEVVRAKGVGFYRFSREEDSREQQMNELRNLRMETVDSRTRHMIASESQRVENELKLQRIAERRARLLQKKKDNTP